MSFLDYNDPQPTRGLNLDAIAWNGSFASDTGSTANFAIHYSDHTCYSAEVQKQLDTLFSLFRSGAMLTVVAFVTWPVAFFLNQFWPAIALAILGLIGSVLIAIGVLGGRYHDSNSRAG